MSTLVIIKFAGDVPTFQRALAERPDDFVRFSQMGKAAGAIHHRFGIGNGSVLVIDEWESPAHFEKFFTNSELQAFIAEVGADTSVPPDVTFAEAIETADQF